MELSIAQPDCDWHTLSPETLRGLEALRSFPADGKPKSNPLAYKACIWLGGEIVAEKETVKTNKPIPKDWTAI